jgi:cytochrome c biogenesis protein CcmG/thiol:disulfide interchange protein DsbE
MASLRTVGVLMLAAAIWTSPAMAERQSAPGGPPLLVQFFKDPKPLTDFSASTLEGQPLRTADLRGKVVLVNFWATWCPPCVVEVPDLVRLQAKYSGRLVIVGVSDDHGAVDIVKNFAAARHVNYPLVMNSPAISSLFPGMVGLPTTFVIDQQGRIVQRHVGQLNMARTEAEVRVLLGEPVDTGVERE